MKKILILGLIVAAVGCSNEPQIDMDEVNKSVALSMLKGSYKTTLNTLLTAPVHINIGTPVTIDTLNFSITATDTVNNLSFEYLNLKEGWVIYKVTFDGKIKYTALGTGSDGTKNYIITETKGFRDSLDDVTTPKQGHSFLEKQ